MTKRLLAKTTFLGGAATFLIAASFMGGAGATTSAAKAATPKFCAAVKARDCTISGDIQGRTAGTVQGGLTLSWTGALVLAQRHAETDPTFVPAAGSSITWTVSGGNGDCSFTGTGTTTTAQLTGDLVVGKPKSGKWQYSMTIGPKHSSTFGVHTMPYQQTCASSGTSTHDAAVDGTVFAYNTYSTGQSPSNLVTNGLKLGGAIHTPPGNQDWTWNLTGEIFSQHVSERGIAVIKRLEGFGAKGRPGWAYEDSVHKCTIGYGHLLLPEGPCGERFKMRWTKAKADAVLRKDLDTMMEPPVRKASMRFGFNQCEYDALLTFAYNVAHGKGGESKSWKKLMAGLDPAGNWRQQIAIRLPKFVHAVDSKTHKVVKLPLLERRRAAELRIFTRHPCPCEGVTA